MSKISEEEVIDIEDEDHESVTSSLSTPDSYPEDARVPSFTEIDRDNSGGLDLSEFKRLFRKNTPIENIEKVFYKLDKDKNGKLDRKEYMKIKAVSFIQKLLLPKDGRIAHEYSCKPPPIFMILITLIEIGVFIYHYHTFVVERGRMLHKYGPAFVDSDLIFSPHHRGQVWRYVTYMFVHSGYMHLVNNIVMQLFLGFLLELVHKWWRILIIYLFGVLFGSLATHIFHPTFYLAGASGGVYALMFAHMSTVILNWPEMQRPGVRVVLFAIYVSFDVGFAVYYSYILEEETHIGYAAHAAGGVAGFLTGIIVLKNLEQKKWEATVWWISFVLFAVITVVGFIWNIFG